MLSNAVSITPASGRPSLPDGNFLTKFGAAIALERDPGSEFGGRFPAVPKFGVIRSPRDIGSEFRMGGAFVPG